MKKLFRDNLAFFFPYFLFLLIAGIFLSLHSKGEAHLILNQYRYEICDTLFCYATWLGDFFAVIVIVFVLCFFNYRFALLVGLSNIFSALITQLLKHTLFSDVDRPTKFFEGIHQLNLVAGYENYLYNSFPSGHTTAAFTTFFCLALIFENKILKFAMFLIALTVGLSRVYLSQHFLNDVYAGSLIGVITTLLFYSCLFSEKAKTISWLNKSLLK
ncbi:MAG: phosphatase PAP2 family protein [Bacteroidetes bacterium]|nr:phosphatase PAP2 family protein [Bacteroidota bacterium]